jgi:hypothetical protein
LHVCLSSSITETNFDTSQFETTRVLLDDLGFFVGDGTSTLDEDGHELSDEVFCKSALIRHRTNELTDSSVGKPVVEAADRPGSERGTRRYELLISSGQ